MKLFKVNAFTWLKKNTCKKNCIYWYIFFPVGHKCLYFWTSRKHTRYEHTECSHWSTQCLRVFCVRGHGGDRWRRWEAPPVLYGRQEHFSSVEGLTLDTFNDKFSSVINTCKCTCISLEVDFIVETWKSFEIKFVGSFHTDFHCRSSD